jgi:hypothetical protein
MVFETRVALLVRSNVVMPRSLLCEGYAVDFLVQDNSVASAALTNW